MAAFPNSRAIKRQLEAENEELRKVLCEEAPRYTLEEWEDYLPQPIRDALAARALIACNGNAKNAAIRLGITQKHAAYSKKFYNRIFGTDGTKELLARDLKEPEENRAALIERQVRIALYGEDAASVRSFQMIAKMCGWIKTPDVHLIQNNRQTILTLVTQKNSRGEIPTGDTIDALPGSFLEHEPGAATRIDSGDLVATALGNEE